MTDERAADQAQYLASWLLILKSDTKEVFAVASKASETASFLSRGTTAICAFLPLHA
jgi:antirestriction protein ArdC